jgi:formate hydrogenlyase subunit 3/multisubunit Na+/H+ antiporter MnhD subunit
MVFITLMFLYPLWVLLCGFVLAFLLIRGLKSSSLGRLLFSLSALSSFFVLLIYLSFKAPLFLEYFHQLLVFELNPVNIFCSLLTLGVSFPFFLLYPFAAKGKKSQEDQYTFLLYSFMLFSSIGAILSSGICSFVIFFELVFLSFFFLIRGKAHGDSFALFDYFVYFGPTLLSLLCAAMLFFVGPKMHETGQFYTTMYARVIFIIVFSARLLMLPLAFSARRMVEVFRKVECTYGLIVSFMVISSGLMKFCRADLEFAYCIVIVFFIIMVLWNVYAYRQKAPGDMLLFLYVVQTAFVMGALALMYVEEQRGIFLFWMLLNHIVSGCGMLIWQALINDNQRGKYVNVISMIFMLSFIGFFPSPGLLGRWFFFQSHLFADGYLSLLAILMLTLGLSSIGLTIKWLPVFWREVKADGNSQIFPPVRILIYCLLIYLFLPLLFIPQLNRFFLFLSTYV